MTPDGLCELHKAKGRLVPGFCRVGGVTMCRECAQGKAIDNKEEKMARTDIDWAAVQRDRDAGMPMAQIEKRYGVSGPTIRTHTKASGNGATRFRDKRTNERTNEIKSPDRRAA
jgi:hypothetical protein